MRDAGPVESFEGFVYIFLKSDAVAKPVKKLFYVHGNPFQKSFI